ncbi:MAG: hypothetical protein IKA83_02450 [Paludibacteraceae bacterium]|nr:hypothetical protein [Paludibacteraceae bacterium]
MKDKEELINKLLEDLVKECKQLGVKYVIAVNMEIKTHATALYIATMIWNILKGLPSEGRQITITLLLQLLEKEIEEE